MAPDRRPSLFFLLAALLGTLHAVPSFYWALGGDWLLATVGQWAVDALGDDVLLAGVGLAVVGVVKLAAAWIPLLAEAGRIPWRRFWRALCWVGGPGLVLYGGVNVVVSSLVLAGVVGDGDYFRPAMIGHAYIWGPLFLLWGAALTVGLVASRGRGLIRPEGDTQRSPRV